MVQVLKKKKKNLKTAAYVDVEKAPFTRFSDMRAKNVPLSGERLQQEAQEFVRTLVRDEFKASSGWLQQFKKCPAASSARWCATSLLRQMQSESLTGYMIASRISWHAITSTNCILPLLSHIVVESFFVNDHSQDARQLEGFGSLEDQLQC